MFGSAARVEREAGRGEEEGKGEAVDTKQDVLTLFDSRLKFNRKQKV